MNCVSVWNSDLLNLPYSDGLGPLVLVRSEIAVFIPVQPNHNKQENAAGFSATRLNNAYLKAPFEKP